MQAALDRDVERVSSLRAFTVTVHTDDETRTVSCRPSDAVHDAVAAAFGRPVEHIEEVLLGDDALQPGETFDDWGIEASTATCSPNPNPRRIPGWQDGARLSMRLRPAKATVEDVVADVIELNPHLTREELMEYVEVDAEDCLLYTSPSPRDS